MRAVALMISPVSGSAKFAHVLQFLFLALVRQPLHHCMATRRHDYCIQGMKSRSLSSRTFYRPSGRAENR